MATMIRSTLVSVLVVLLALYAWRNGSRARILFQPVALPSGYYSGGAWETHCTRVHAAPSPPPPQPAAFCEDAFFWDHINGEGGLAKRLLYLTCDPGRKRWNTVMGPLAEPEPRGALWVLGLDEGAEALQQVKFEGYPEGRDFHPLGAAIWPAHLGSEEESEGSPLYIVNHARHNTTIELFLLSPLSPTVARYVRTISHASFVAPNAVALTSPHSFYVSNDHRFTRRLPSPLGNVLPIAESVLGLPLGWVAHVSVDPKEKMQAGVQHEIVAKGIPFPNGVHISHDGRILAVASTTLTRVLLFPRDPASNHLGASAAAVDVPFVPDNLHWADGGRLVVAGHPHFPTLAQVAANKTARAPSWVLALAPRAAAPGVAAPSLAAPALEHDSRAPVSAAVRAPAHAEWETETLFQSDGTAFSSSSTGLVDGRTGVLYVTGLYDEGVLVCKP